MNRIITRGLGAPQLLVTRGYGFGGIIERLREAIRLVSKIGRELLLVSKWQKTN